MWNQLTKRSGLLHCLQGPNHSSNCPKTSVETKSGEFVCFQQNRACQSPTVVEIFPETLSSCASTSAGVTLRVGIKCKWASRAWCCKVNWSMSRCLAFQRPQESVTKCRVDAEHSGSETSNKFDSQNQPTSKQVSCTKQRIYTYIFDKQAQSPLKAILPRDLWVEANSTMRSGDGRRIQSLSVCVWPWSVQGRSSCRDQSKDSRLCHWSLFFYIKLWCVQRTSTGFLQTKSRCSLGDAFINGRDGASKVQAGNPTPSFMRRVQVSTSTRQAWLECHLFVQLKLETSNLLRC